MKRFEEGAVYEFTNTTIDLEDFFKTKVWRTDILPLVRFGKQDLLDSIAEQDGPVGDDLFFARGRLAQMQAFLELEEYVLDEKSEQIEEKEDE